MRGKGKRKPNPRYTSKDADIRWELSLDSLPDIEDSQLLDIIELWSEKWWIQLWVQYDLPKQYPDGNIKTAIQLAHFMNTFGFYCDTPFWERRNNHFNTCVAITHELAFGGWYQVKSELEDHSVIDLNKIAVGQFCWIDTWFGSYFLVQRLDQVKFYSVEISFSQLSHS